MKKLLLEIFAMMLVCMGAVYAISGTARLVMRAAGHYDADIVYYVSLAAGLCGLLLFALFLNLFLIRRVKRISRGVNEVAGGNYDVAVSDRGIDEIRTLTDDFNTMASELKSNEYLSRNFIRNVSHEMKTPLSTMIGYAELIQRGAGDEWKEYAGIIIAEAEKLLRASGQMLEISRLDSSSVLDLEDVFYVDEQIRDVVLGLQNEWLLKEIDMEIDMERTQWKGNEELTRHIWQNLISNAVKFTPAKGRISIALRKNDDLLFRISNSGEGIPDENKPYLFDLFFTHEKGENKRGTGLGLPIVKRIVDKLNGTIDFKSDAAQTEFTVILRR